MDLNLHDHVAVVTGGASGIGRAVVQALLAEGCRVAVWDISTSDPRATSQYPGPASIHSVLVDVTDFASVQRAADETESTLGPIDHLVHAAAIGSGKFGFPFTNLQPGDWPRVWEVNVQGMVHVAHAVAPRMRERRSGTLVFLGSVAGQIGSQTDPPYSAAKAAGINFAQCLAKDLAASGVRVNTVNPGMVRTPLNESVWRAWNESQSPAAKKTYAEWAEEKIRLVVPLNRWQEPEDVADMVVFLSSDRARQVTGQTINVDGGFVMRG